MGGLFPPTDLVLMQSESNTTITRQQFLRGFWSQLMAEVNPIEHQPQVSLSVFMLPPGSSSWSHLKDNCTQCYACLSACPHEALRVIREDNDDHWGLPAIQADQNACHNCVDKICIDSCPTDALIAGVSGARRQEIFFDEGNCLSYRGQFCITCATQCPAVNKAIIIDPGGHPVWKEENCLGCGTCIQICPAPERAIGLKQRESECLSPV